MEARVTESTFQGYVATTHDALIIFEAVRRGRLPKIPRRLKLKDERENALLTSGHVFVFDEGESGIKRWTDGMLWSPSRVLNNFLIYRQVHSKSSKSSKNEESAPTPAALPSGLASGAPLMAPTFYPSGNGNEDSGPSEVRRDSEGSMMSENFSPSVPTFGGYFQGAPPQDQMANQNHRQFGSAPNSAGSASSFNFAPTGPVAASSPLAFDPASRRNSIVKDDMMGEGDSSMSREEQALNRELVGSLTSNYLFIKGGLCKKTISMKINGSTQHLISYYSVEDVRAGRLRRPSSLPEFVSISISPIFLNPANFREPPQTEVGPDGNLRYVSDRLQSSRTSGQGSSSEGTSGSESRVGTGRVGKPSFNQNGRVSPTTLFTSASPTATANSSPNLEVRRPEGGRLPHQIGGSGAISSDGTSAVLARRMSDGPLRGRVNSGGGRYEPYPHPALFNQGVPGVSSRGSRPVTPASTSSFEAASPPASRGGDRQPARHLSHHASLGSHLNLWHQPQSEGNSPFQSSGMTSYPGGSDHAGPSSSSSTRRVAADPNPTGLESSWSESRVPLLPPNKIGHAHSHGSASVSSSGSDGRHERHHHSGSGSSHSSLYGHPQNQDHLQGQGHQQHQAQHLGPSPNIHSERSHYLPPEMQNLDSSRTVWEMAAGHSSFPYENALPGANEYQYGQPERYYGGEGMGAIASAGERDHPPPGRSQDWESLWSQPQEAQQQQQHQQQHHHQQRIQTRPARAHTLSAFNGSQPFYPPNFEGSSSQRPEADA